MGAPEIRNELRSYILNEFLPGESADNLLDDTPLRTSGVLDSIKLLQLVNHIESTYSIAIEAHEAGNVANFDTIEAIAEMIAGKR